MKKVLMVLFALVATVTLVGCGDTDSRPTLVVGLEVDYPPFNWGETTQTDTNWPVDGVPGLYAEGYDVQIARKIADGLDRRLVIKMIAWGSLVESVTANEIDVIIAGMSPTAERKLTIDFTDVYYTSNHVVVVKADSAYANITTLAGLSGAKGVGQIATTYAELVDMVGSEYGAKVLPVRDTIPLISTDLNSGSADFTIVEKPVALGMIKAFPTLKIILDSTENIFNVSEEDTQLAIGISKSNTELKTQINEILSGITQAQRDALMTEAVNKQED